MGFTVKLEGQGEVIANKLTERIIKFTLNITKRLVYQDRNVWQNPMKAAARVIERTLRSHLNVTKEFRHMGFASGLLYRSVKTNFVTSDEIKGESKLQEAKYYGFSVDFTYATEFENYGFYIGDEGGFTQKASLEQIANWIARKGIGNFYDPSPLTPAGNPRQKGKREFAMQKARRIAYFIMRKRYNQQTVVLPKWYSITDKDENVNRDMANAVKRTLNLFSKKFDTEVKKFQKAI